MPGNPDHTTKHYITPQKVYREGIETDDTDVPTEYLHLEGNQHAVDNHIWLILEDHSATPTPGATVTLTLYAKFSGSVTVPVKIAGPFTGLTSAQLITIPQVPAYPIAVKLTGRTSGTWRIHAAHTGNNNAFAR